MSGSRHIIKRETIEREGLEIMRAAETARESRERAADMRDPRTGQTEMAEIEDPPAKADSEQVVRVRRLVQAMLSGFARQRRELLAELQPYVTRISVEVAQRIVRRELRTDPGMITRVVGAALEQVAAASRVRVRVHPLDARTLQETLREIVSAPDEAEAIEVIPDGSIERGGCVVESDRGIVDARLQTQFEEMQTSLLDALEAHRLDEGAAR